MSENPEISLDMLLDVNVTLSVELGRTKMTIKDLMALNKGSIISMAKEVTEPMDLMVNGTLIARGDVVESEGQFGLRLLDIVSADERLKPLK
ncbi:MAG: flagellar motor switch protein FliN [Proteobacteria bacterium]|jgi:flagellar motor switch protein FliN/FliY|nr:flagellar motor switch protein FliN [Pseudomonadota bacterium]